MKEWASSAQGTTRSTSSDDEQIRAIISSSSKVTSRAAGGGSARRMPGSGGWGTPLPLSLSGSAAGAEPLLAGRPSLLTAGQELVPSPPPGAPPAAGRRRPHQARYPRALQPTGQSVETGVGGPPAATTRPAAGGASETSTIRDSEWSFGRPVHPYADSLDDSLSGGHAWQPADQTFLERAGTPEAEALEAAAAAELASLLSDMLGARLRVDVTHRLNTPEDAAAAAAGPGGEAPAADAEDDDRDGPGPLSPRPSTQVLGPRDASGAFEADTGSVASTHSVEIYWAQSLREDSLLASQLGRDDASTPMPLPLLLDSSSEALEQEMDAKLWYLRWEEESGAAWNVDMPAESWRAKAWPSPLTRAVDAAVSTAGVITFFLCVRSQS